MPTVATAQDRRVLNTVLAEGERARMGMKKIEDSFEAFMREAMKSYSSARDDIVKGLLDRLELGPGGIIENNAKNAAAINQSLNRIRALNAVALGPTGELMAGTMAHTAGAAALGAENITRTVGKVESAALTNAFRAMDAADAAQLAHSLMSKDIPSTPATSILDDQFSPLPVPKPSTEAAFKVQKASSASMAKMAKIFENTPDSMKGVMYDIRSMAMSDIYNHMAINTEEIKARMLRRVIDPTATSASLRKELEGAGLFRGMRDAAGRRVTVSERADRISSYTLKQAYTTSQQRTVTDIYGMELKPKDRWFLWSARMDGRVATDSVRRHGQILPLTKWATNDFGDRFRGLAPLRPRDRCHCQFVQPDWFSPEMRDKYFNDGTAAPPLQREALGEKIKRPKKKKPPAKKTAAAEKPSKLRHKSVADAQKWSKKNLGIDIDVKGIKDADSVLALERVNSTLARIERIHKTSPTTTSFIKNVTIADSDDWQAQAISRAKIKASKAKDAAERSIYQDIVIPLNPRLAADFDSLDGWTQKRISQRLGDAKIDDVAERLSLINTYDDVVDEAIYRSHIKGIGRQENPMVIQDPLYLSLADQKDFDKNLTKVVQQHQAVPPARLEPYRSTLPSLEWASETDVERAVSESLVALQNGKYKRGMLPEGLESKMLAYADIADGLDPLPPLAFWGNNPDVREFLSEDQQRRAYRAMKLARTEEWLEETSTGASVLYTSLSKSDLKMSHYKIYKEAEKNNEVVAKLIMDMTESIETLARKYPEQFGELRIGALRLSMSRDFAGQAPGSDWEDIINIGDQAIKVTPISLSHGKKNVNNWLESGGLETGIRDHIKSSTPADTTMHELMHVLGTANSTHHLDEWEEMVDNLLHAGGPFEFMEKEVGEKYLQMGLDGFPGTAWLDKYVSSYSYAGDPHHHNVKYEMFAEMGAIFFDDRYVPHWMVKELGEPRGMMLETGKHVLPTEVEDFFRNIVIDTGVHNDRITSIGQREHLKDHLWGRDD